MMLRDLHDPGQLCLVITQRSNNIYNGDMRYILFFFIFPLIHLKVEIILLILTPRESLRKRKKCQKKTLFSRPSPQLTLPRYVNVVRKRE